ncbi:carbamoyltransferase HypF [uncultured Desulfovibrio sp.]|uniref:carbamoyltransferase HypF n=1 Tax=uncultured Desulfovibrio sp. TaxID=167968 RepID=UPI0025E66F04|nr:carbamoyltransferase HypF [uncultured Desulfovibrio sp.]
MVEHNEIHCRCLVGGQVQGVGFRPFVYRLAVEEELAGQVGNTSEGVRIDIQGPSAAVERFLRRLRAELPPLARLTRLEREDLPVDNTRHGAAFRIVESTGRSGHSVLVSPDVGICGDCLREMRDPADPRHGYAFTNCTNCGPRYTITRAIPYDRATTSMACFPLCPRCAAEYGDPLDRRFHAQPVACPVCGPRLWLVRTPDADRGAPPAREAVRAGQALAEAAAVLRQGGILALKGLGGFQLACDARRDDTVARLRQRKSRPHKAFAVMLPDLDAARACCRLSPEHAALLCAPEKPIVLCPVREESGGLSPLLAPDTDSLGIMLPYTPLHVALFDALARETAMPPALVMTSANPRGEPLCLGNREALARLRHEADAFLLHDRDILVRVDDSVTALFPAGQAGGAAPFFHRRARGYVPRPVPLDLADAQSPTVCGTGAQLKATLCLTRGRDAFVSQHIGDLENLPTARFYEEVSAHLERLLEVRPELLVCDLHPDLLSSRWARERASREGLPLLRLQHHAAHAAAVLAEHGRTDGALAICLDGTGLGTDGIIWGGEVLSMELEALRWQRLGGLSPFALPGGEAAIREPWRLALALREMLGQADEPASWDGTMRPPVDAWGADAQLAAARTTARHQASLLREMLRWGVNCPLTSSCGRLFDAVSAELGICLATSYEGQAAIRLETLARCPEARPLADEEAADELLRPPAGDDETWRLDTPALFAAVQHDAARYGAATAALRFHERLAGGLARLAARLAAATGFRTVALAGGCLQNLLLARLLLRALRARGLHPLLPLELPPGDGGLSLGQAAWGLCAWKSGKLPPDGVD